jgi:hypothetical protein
MLRMVPSLRQGHAEDLASRAHRLEFPVPDPPRPSRICGALRVAVVQAAASIVSPSAVAASALMSVSLARVAARPEYSKGGAEPNQSLLVAVQ